MNELKADFYPRYGDTHIVLYDLFDPSHCENEDKRDERGVATGRWHIGDLLMREKERNWCW